MFNNNLLYNKLNKKITMDITNLILKDFTENGFSEVKTAKILDIVNRFSTCTDASITVFGPIAAIPNNGSYILRDLRHGWGYKPLNLEYKGELTKDAIKAFLKSKVNVYRDSADQIDQMIKDFYKD